MLSDLRRLRRLLSSVGIVPLVPELNRFNSTKTNTDCETLFERWHTTAVLCSLPRLERSPISVGSSPSPWVPAIFSTSIHLNAHSQWEYCLDLGGLRKQRNLPSLLHSLMFVGMVTDRSPASAPTLIAPEDHNREIVALLRRAFLHNKQSDPWLQERLYLRRFALSGDRLSKENCPSRFGFLLKSNISNRTHERTNERQRP
jgi:hypothetical protein